MERGFGSFKVYMTLSLSCCIWNPNQSWLSEWFRVCHLTLSYLNGNYILNEKDFKKIVIIPNILERKHSYESHFKSLMSFHELVSTSYIVIDRNF